MSSAVTRVNDEKKRAISMLKSDRFLADADWSMVGKIAKITDPYKHLDSQEVQSVDIACFVYFHCSDANIKYYSYGNKKWFTFMMSSC